MRIDIYRTSSCFEAFVFLPETSTKNQETGATAHRRYGSHHQ